LRYLITFACYGAHLHGDESGSVDRHHKLPGSPVVETHPQREADEAKLMDQTPYLLDPGSRAAVLEAIREVCHHRGWNLLAAHVRTTHVHAIVEAGVQPERIMNAFKSYASRRLNRLGRDGPNRKRWARHGSTRWLWDDEDVRRAIQYVVEQQGEPMAVFCAEESF
jgi:REP element-mobilizing transposase RayT